ncbi:hypothetical protein SAMN04487943_105222 [Gracilibacillus orientalis]|uniref:DUF4350 domain-containing protein n=1 Tax=Gracilibacillus orientalis TaxID=334253 RepID=A0A1I4LVQ6_9BACI|nr:DUF4350 domain-containing protein [Gracilibacillus orientalis]SFL94777.1 hypothetical protein SAMN04487943_105222 [Gracilibacillus orientalis]
MFDKKTWIIGVIFLFLLIVVSIFSTSNTSEQYPPYLVESPSPTGLKAIYTYLEQGDYDVSSEETLPATTEETLRILVNPPVFSDNNIENHYLDYVREGNTVVLAKENPDGLFNLQTEYAVTESFNTEPQTTTEADYQGEPLEVLQNSFLRLTVNDDDIVLLEDNAGALAIERKVGEGSLIVLLEPAWLTNEHITEHDHTAAIFNLIPFEESKTVIFDEYSLATSGGLVSYFELFPGWAYVLLVQGLIITIFILWNQGKRFGPIYPVREETVRLSNERVRALAIWQSKGKNYQASLQYQLEYLKEVIRERYGIPYHHSWKERLTRMEEKIDSISAKELDYIAQGIETISSRKSLNKHEYLSWSAKIDKIREEVE